MADDALDARRGNLYGISTLSGNWFEDRIQHTKGSTTDGLRGDKYTFEDGNNNSVIRQKDQRRPSHERHNIALDQKR